MSEDGLGDVPKGAVPLSEAIGALRTELTRAFLVARGKSLRFEPSPVELTLQVAVTSGGKANAGVKWWLISAGGEVSRQSVITQTVKITLEPIMVDENGDRLEFLIDADDAPSTGSSSEIPLDAPA
jgi:hypothetical protein